MMATAGTSETSTNFYQTTRHNIPKDSLLHRQQMFEHQFCAMVKLEIIKHFISLFLPIQLPSFLTH
jgi:hypothetical protein